MCCNWPIILWSKHPSVPTLFNRCTALLFTRTSVCVFSSGIDCDYAQWHSSSQALLLLIKAQQFSLTLSNTPCLLWPPSPHCFTRSQPPPLSFHISCIPPFPHHTLPPPPLTPSLSPPLIPHSLTLPSPHSSLPHLSPSHHSSLLHLSPSLPSC